MKTKNLIFALAVSIGLFTSCEYIDYDWNDHPQKDRKTVEEDYRELVENEFAFAKLTSSTSLKQGFLSFLSDDGVIFRGDFVTGKEFFESQEPTTDILSWKPVLADISSTGNFGYTTGPYTILRPESSPNTGYGEYVSVWERQTDGSWKVVFDLGVPYGDPGQSFPDIIFPEEYSLKLNIDRDTEKLRNGLIEVDAFFSNISSSESLKNAYSRFLSKETRLLRFQSIPFSTPEAVNQVVQNATQQPTFELVDARVSKLGDLGYTYGFTDLDGQRSPYLRIWKTEKFVGWRIALELTFITVEPSI